MSGQCLLQLPVAAQHVIHEVAVGELAELQREREGKAVSRALGALETSARDEGANLMSDLIDCVKSEATIQEICDVLRGVFGEAEPVKL